MTDPTQSDVESGDALVLAPLAAAPYRSVRRRRHPRQWWRRRSVRKRVRIGLYVLGFLALLAVVQLGWAAWQMKSANTSLTSAKVALAEGDVTTAVERTADANKAAGRAEWGTFGPHLWAAQALPLLGDDVRAVRTVVDVSEAATGGVATDLFELRTLLDPEAIRPINGQVDLSKFEQASEEVSGATGELGKLDDRLRELDLDGLVGPLRAPILELVEELHRTRSLVDYGDGVLDMVPAALGADGPRRYLVAFQNNAEFRATGGIPGSFSVVTADQGRLQMGDQAAVPDFGAPRKVSVLPETPEERLLFDGKVGRFVQDVNLTPDWPRSAQLLAAMWKDVSDQPLDGILSIDPVVLSYILRGSGPVPLTDGKVARAENAVQVLLNQPYVDYRRQQEQNAFFEESARRIFDALITGRGDAATSLRGLNTGIREGRGYVWMSRPEEQDRVAGGVAAGNLRRTAGERPDIGVFFNDSTITKLDYWITSSTDVLRSRCLDGGRQRLEVTTRLKSHVPEGAGRFPYLLLGERVSDTPGDVLLSVLAYAPVGSTVSNPTIDGRTGAPASFTHDGHPVTARTVLLSPGQTMTLSWTVETAPGQIGAPVLRTTPGAQSSGLGVVEQIGCPRGD